MTDNPIYLDPKDPVEVVDYVFDFSGLMAASATIASHTLNLDGLTATDVAGDKTVTITVAGGFAGRVYRPSCTVVTDEIPPRTYKRSLAFQCLNL